MTLANLKRMVAVAMLSSIAMGAFAEDAPVYDVDNYPPQFDGAPDASGSPQSSPSASAQQDLQPQLQSPHSDNTQVVEQPSAPPPPASLTMDQRMRRVEQQVNNAQQSGPKVDALQSQVQTLRGQVEELTHQLQQLQTQQRAMFADIDKRLTKPSVNETSTVNTDAATPQPLASEGKIIKADVSPVPPAKKAAVLAKAANISSSAVPLEKTAAAPAVTDNQPNVAEEQQIYQTAYDFIKAKKYNDAVAALQKMLQKYPSGQFAANAHYWLGELYGLLNKNDLSAKEFSTVVSDYPDSPKVSDAQLKVGLIYAGQFKWVDAKGAFKKVINRYPGTSSARLAAEQLKQIKLAGH